MEYRLTKRKGRKVQVSYDNGETWISTGCDTISEAHKYVMGNTSMSLRDYADRFYDRTDKQSYLFTIKARNISLVPSTLYTKRILLSEYILKEFGNWRISDIKAIDIRRWLLPLCSVRNGKPLGASMKNMVLWVFSEVLDYAVEDGVVDSNEAKKVKRIRKTKTRKGVISADELKIIFPDDDRKLRRIWGDSALFFLIMRDTGFRPSEVLGLRREDIIGNYVYTAKMYDEFTKTVEDRIKTTNSGKDYKVGVLSAQTLRFVPEGQLFDITDTNRHKMNNIFKSVCLDYLGRDDLTQYCLRHAFMTNLISKYPRELIMELMGHTKWESCYDDRTPEMIIENLNNALTKYNK